MNGQNTGEQISVKAAEALSRERDFLDYGVDSPARLKALPKSELTGLASSIRRFLIDNVQLTGGHLGSNLGVVELTIAIHRVFDSPRDHIVWDVGHQSYVHKMLTGRAREFNTLRAMGGLSGFTRRAESVHDAFGAGHASTSISAAAGFAEADSLAGSRAYTVAVIGDGSFTGGMVYEAMLNVRKSDRLIVILNDNEMSISRNVGRIAEYLTRVRTAEPYFEAKAQTKRLLHKIPILGSWAISLISKYKSIFRRELYHTTFFEQLGFDYIGPVDGSNIPRLEAALHEAARRNKPVFVHVNTCKGKGFAPAEERPERYHNISPACRAAADAQPFRKESSFSDTFGKFMIEAALDDKNICALTAAMSEGTCLVDFAKLFPSRFFDVGIAEGHAVTFAAGLACRSLTPVFAVYSTFLQRAYDQILHDVCLQGLHVVLAIDRAGLTGPDGQTHQGLYDVSLLCALPGIEVYSPATYRRFEDVMRQALYRTSGPAAVRYPRGDEDGGLEAALPVKMYVGERIVAYGTDTPDRDAMIITYGRLSSNALKAAALHGNCGVISLQCLKPLDFAWLARRIPQGCTRVLFAEEGVLHGGIAEQFGAWLAQSQRHSFRYKIIAAVSGDVPPGTVEQQEELLGLDAQALSKMIDEM